MEFHHKPVLFHETIEALAIQPEGIYIDGTMGGGGHSEAILQRLTTGKLLSIDQDPDAMRAAGERLASYPQSIRVQGNFAQMRQLAESRGIQRANGVLLDIGVSSYQLDTPERGFSYHYDAPLDMRMSQEGPSAKDLVNSLSEEELSSILFRYGEERSARRIARGICQAREKAPIQTTAQLAEIVKASVPAAVRRAEGHPARKTFQALRIAVNGELDRLREGLQARLRSAPARRPPGRDYLPLPGGQDCQAANARLVPGLHLSQGLSRLRLRQEAPGQAPLQKGAGPFGGRGGGKPPGPQRQAAGDRKAVTCFPATSPVGALSRPSGAGPGRPEAPSAADK